MGRPPKTYSDEQVIELGKDLVEWINSDEGKKTAIWVPWYFIKHGMIRSDWHTLIQRPDFLPYYQAARQIMADNIMHNTKIAQSYGNRYLHRYDDELGADEEAAREREAARARDNLDPVVRASLENYSLQSKKDRAELLAELAKDQTE